MKFYNVDTIYLKQVRFGNSFISCGLDISLFPPFPNWPRKMVSLSTLCTKSILVIELVIEILDTDQYLNLLKFTKTKFNLIQSSFPNIKNESWYNQMYNKLDVQLRENCGSKCGNTEIFVVM